MKRNLEDILETMDLSPTDKGQYFIVRCPSCGKKEMFIYKSSKKMICNRRNKCGAELNLLDFLRENFSLYRDSLEIEIKSKEQPKESRLEIPEGLRFFSEKGMSIIKKRAVKYLASRNIPKSNILKLGYIFEPGSIYNNTIFFPFFENSSLVYFTTRDFTNSRFTYSEDGEKSPLRYIAAKGLNSHNFVFNIDEIDEDKDLFIFEGLMDALTLERQVGTATLTSTLGDKQAIKIWDKAPRRIILVPDSDEAGQKNLIKNYKKLLFHRPPSLENVEVLIYKLPSGVKDFNETGKNFIDVSKCECIKKGAILIAPW